jgi:hypothetical protein
MVQSSVIVYAISLPFSVLTLQSLFLLSRLVEPKQKIRGSGNSRAVSEVNRKSLLNSGVFSALDISSAKYMLSDEEKQVFLWAFPG